MGVRSEQTPFPPDASTAEFVSLAGEPDAERFIDAILPGVHAAGIPYVDWLFGGAHQARAALRDLMRRPSSEVFVKRATLRTVGGIPVGGFIALGGSEVSACRSADALAVLKLAGPGGRSAAARRIGEAQKLFPPVEANQFYLSRIWVASDAAGAGHGPALMREFLAAGRRSGFRRFRGDICSGNHGVIRFAHWFKLETLEESVSHDAAMSYVSVLRIEDGGRPIAHVARSGSS